MPQTGGWLKWVVQGYFNYYAVPGNLESLAVFVAGASNATYRGPGCLRWVDDGYLKRACSIPTPQFASPPVL